MKDFRLYMQPITKKALEPGALPCGFHLQCEDGVVLSIQAGTGTYCSPRRDLKKGEDPTIYEAFEVGLWDGDQEWICPSKEGHRFHDRTWAELWSSGDGVAPYVEAHVVEMILKDIGDLSKLEAVDWEAVWTDERYSQDLDDWQNLDVEEQ